MRYVIALLLGAILINGLLNPEAKAESQGSWVGESLKVVSEVAEAKPSPNKLSCAGNNSRIQMVGEEVFRAACVYGNSTKPRVARIVNLAGQFEYAISFTPERNFYPLEYLCLGIDRCAYSQSEDALLHKALLSDGSYTYRLIKNFSKQLQRVDGERVAYRAQGLEGELLLDGATMTTLGVSSNGRWAVIEVARKGIVRLDFRTGQTAWVASLVVNGASPQPILGLAVSNDGRWVATTGWYQGVTVYEVAEHCGQSGAFAEVTSWCAASSAHKSELLQGYVRAYRPAFSGDGMRVSLFLVRQQGGARVTITPESRVDTQAARYIALGDSYTSEEGELADSFYLAETNSATNHCHVSSRSYPLLLGSIWNMPAVNMACSGSRIADARQRAFTLTDVEPLLVSLGVGGNDIDLIGKLKSCLGLGTCEWAQEGVRLSTAQEMKKILPDLVQLIEEIKLSTGAAVFLVGYPSIVNTETSQCDAITASLLSHAEREYIEESLQYLNTILRSAAQYADATFVDVSQAFVGERLCEGAQRGMNAVRVGDDIAPLEFLKGVKFIGAESFHPTPFGHQKIAEAIQERYGAFWLASDCGSCLPSVEYPSYWTRGVAGLGIAFTQSAMNFIAGDNFKSGSEHSFSFAPDSFSPNSSVRVELRSDAQVLAEYIAKDDGSLSGSVTFPNGVTGHHTVHVIGTSHSGEAIDIYQSVYLQAPEEKLLPPSTTAQRVTNPTVADIKRENIEFVVLDTTISTQQKPLLTKTSSDVRGVQAQQREAPVYSIDLLRMIAIGVLLILSVVIILLLLRRKV